MKSLIFGALALLMAETAQGEARVEPAPLPPGWLIHPLPEGAELRFVPLAVTLQDYPKMALRRDEQGTSLLNLQIDALGHLVGCTIARSSGSSLLDEEACQLYRQRGRFELRGTTQTVTVQAPVVWAIVD